MIYLVLASHLWAKCPEKIAAEAFKSQLLNTRSAIIDKRFQDFKTEREKTVSLLPCLKEKISPEQVAMFHQMQSIKSFMDRDLAKMGSSVLAASLSAPTLAYPLESFPSDHIMLQYISFAQAQKSARKRKLSKPRKGQIAIDGKLTNKAPVDRPYIFQYMDKLGDTQTTSLVAAGKVPSYPSWTGNKPLKIRLQPQLSIAAGSLAITGIGTGIWAANTNAKFWNPQTSKNELKSLQTQANILSSTTVGLGMLSTGLLTAAIITGAW